MGLLQDVISNLDSFTITVQDCTETLDANKAIEKNYGTSYDINEVVEIINLSVVTRVLGNRMIGNYTQVLLIDGLKIIPKNSKVVYNSINYILADRLVTSGIGQQATFLFLEVQ